MSAHAASSALTDALQEHHIYYELIPHRRTQSAVAEARAIGVDHRKGRLAAGMDADLVVFSPSLEIRQTFVGGRSVYSLMSPRSK